MGRAPKFPQPMNWEFLLRYWKRTGIVQAQDMSDLTLTKMARGGMYDQLGGGFHRYSVDGQWLVPHFEKMLYDNAQLASLYLHGWLATDDPEYRRVGEETLDYILREMTHASGGFFSAQDADSEGVEGKFFVWSAEEIATALDDPEMARVALAYWGVDRGPNFEGHSILFVPREPSEVAEDLGLSEARLEELVAARPRAALRACGTSGCTLGSTTRSSPRGTASPSRPSRRPAASLGRADYIAAAVRNAAFIVTQMKDGGEAAPLVEGRPGQDQGLSRGLRHGGRGPPRPLRGDVRPPLARRVAPARRAGPGPFLGRGRGHLLRHGHRSRGAGGAAAQPLRQCGPDPAPR